MSDSISRLLNGLFTLQTLRRGEGSVGKFLDFSLLGAGFASRRATERRGGEAIAIEDATVVN